MRIVVIGSWRPLDRDWPLRGLQEDFVKACHQIGREFARREQVVVVGGSSASSADQHLVNGIIEVAGNTSTRPLIEVILPDDDTASFRDEGVHYPKLFSFPPLSQRGWGATHLFRLRDADGVLAIGGAAGTYQAGLAAILAKKPLAAIGSFGGAAAKLLHSLHGLNPPSGTELNALNGPWSSQVLETSMRVLGVDRQARLLIIHGRAPDRYELFDWLRSALQLNDLLIMRQEFGGGRTLPEKFESLAARADGAIAIATPDDVGALLGTAQPGARARQNVWLEVGWAWGRLGRHRLMVLTRGDVEIPSDLHGLEHYPYAASPLETTEAVRAFVHQLAGSV